LLAVAAPVSQSAPSGGGFNGFGSTLAKVQSRGTALQSPASNEPYEANSNEAGATRQTSGFPTLSLKKLANSGATTSPESAMAMQAPNAAPLPSKIPEAQVQSVPSAQPVQHEGTQPDVSSFVTSQSVFVPALPNAIAVTTPPTAVQPPYLSTPSTAWLEPVSTSASPTATRTQQSIDVPPAMRSNALGVAGAASATSSVGAAVSLLSLEAENTSSLGSTSNVETSPGSALQNLTVNIQTSPPPADSAEQPDVQVQSDSTTQTVTGLQANLQISDPHAMSTDSSLASTIGYFADMNPEVNAATENTPTTRSSERTGLSAQIGEISSQSNSASSSPMDAPNSLTEIADSRISAAPILNSGVNPGPCNIPLNGSAVGAASQVAHAAEQNAPDTANVIAHAPLAATRPSGASAQPAGVVAGASPNQTPFSVFFSDSGNGIQSAASVLPKMVLPPSNGGLSAALGHPVSDSATSANSQPTEQSNNTIKPSASQNSKQPSSNSEGANVANPPAHSSADANAGTDAVVAQSSAAQLPPTPTSALPTVPIAGQPATVGSNPQPASTQTQPQAPVSSAAPAAVTNIPEPQLVGQVQVAQLVSRAGESEMRIGINTTAFGSVEVRTVIHVSDVGLVIGSEKGDLHALLSNEMPALSNTLQQQNLRLNSVSFTQGFASSSNSSGSNPQQRAPAPILTPMSPAGSDSPAEDNSDPPALAWSSGGLSILA
jgi:hypothetical protein